MKRLVIGGLVLLSICVGAASASTLYVPGWDLWGGVAYVSVTVGSQTESGGFFVGSFDGVLDSVPLADPLYCLDIFHSFGFGQTWNVDPIVVPPDPANPPPLNTGEAAWLYHTYGLGISSTEAYKAGAVQVALWEISHEQDWRANYPLHPWYSYGDFQYTYDSNSARDQYTTAILGDLHDNYTPDQYWGTYYQPNPQPTIAGQGLFGNGSPPVPEPSSLLLLGFGLVGAAFLRRAR